MKLSNIIIASAFIGILTLTAWSADDQKTFTGVVSDSMCGKHHMAKDKTAAQCTRICAKGGSGYALVVGDRIYTLKGANAEIVKFAGGNATVTGDAKGEVINVSSISAAKK